MVTRSVGDGQGELCQRVAGTGGDEHQIGHIGRANRFRALYGADNGFFADLLRFCEKICRFSEAGVQRSRMIGKDRENIVFSAQRAHQIKILTERAERTGQGKAQSNPRHTPASFPRRCFRRSAIICAAVYGAVFPGRESAQMVFKPSLRAHS